MVLWEEYRAVDPAGYGYSRFCDLFREFERRLSPTMRQDHPAGDKNCISIDGSCRPSSAKRSRTRSSAAFATNRSPAVPAPAKSASIFRNFSRNWDSVGIGRLG
jgi:hypothetical protein